MIFTGSELIQKRNFYTQTGVFGFEFSCLVDNTSGTYHFGLSGSNGTLDFRLEGGKIWYQDQFIHSYRTNEQFIVEAQFTTGHSNILKNDVALVYGNPKNTGAFDYFYISRQNDQISAVWDLNISGNNLPTYSITTLGYLLSSGQQGVTGYFINTSAWPIRVFNSEIQASQNYQFGSLVSNLGSLQTGTFAYSGDFDSFNLTQPILTTFNTNFDDTSILFTIIDARTRDKFVYLTAPTDFSFNQAGQLARSISWLNYSGGVVTNNYNTNLSISLTYVSGTGIFAGGTGITPYSTTVIGQFAKSGLMTGFVTTPTGNFIVTTTGWATGVTTGFFSGMGTGLASGLNYTGLAVGIFTGYQTGFVFDGSGTLNLTYPLVGISLSGSSLNSTGAAVYATGYIDVSSIPADGTHFFFIINPNGTDYEDSPICQFAASPVPSSHSCDNSDPQFPFSSFQTTTDLVKCMSGATLLGVNGIVRSTNIVDLTATVAGTSSNVIAITGGEFLGSDPITMPGSGFMSGGKGAIGPTGLAVIPIGVFTGSQSIVITGSGIYNKIISGSIPGFYTKTFTGSWDLLTGVDTNSMISLENLGQFNQTTISGIGICPPNSSIIMQVVHNIVDTNQDACQLVISGIDILNPINQILTN